MLKFPKLKICGITRLKDALFCAENRVDYLGFIFYSKSKRYIEPKLAKEIIIETKKENKNIKFIGVFVNEDLDILNSTINNLELDFIQLHGFEDINYCLKIDKPIIKNIRTVNEIEEYSSIDYFLIDKNDTKNFGGTGELANWKFAKEAKNKLSNINKKLILSGGINESNIIQAITEIKPDIVDISSGVEDDFGIKNHKKIKKICNLLNKGENNEN